MNNFQVEKNQKRNPMAEYLLKIQLIITNTEFKNSDEANVHETLEMKLEGEKYCRAVKHEDAFESYEYQDHYIYRLLMDNGIPEEKIPFYLKNKIMIPLNIKNIMLEKARQDFIESYSEENPYYVMLEGRPFPGSKTLPPERVLTIPEEFYEIYQDLNVIERDQAVHEMPVKYQEIFMNTTYYQQMLKDYPNQKYLKYLGSRSIPIYESRPAHDGDILKINVNSLSTSHPIFGNVSVETSMIHLFTNMYNETHRYVYGTLRGDFADIYANYNSFIRFLTIYMTIGSCLNELMKQSTSMIYMNQSTANDFFMLYGLPSVIMEGPSKLSFLKQFRMILQDKGTNIVYRVKDLIGYQYTDIYTLVMVKQQVFENGHPKYYTDDEGNRVPMQEIVFRRLGTTDDNTSYFKYRDERTTYSWEEIASGDPRWWNTPEVEAMLYEMNYSLSNSKYIQLSTHLSMTDIYWQCVILIRGLLDNRYETEYIKIATNLNLNGEAEISVFEAVLILEILMNWHLTTIRGDSLHGDIYSPNGVYNGEMMCIDMLFNGLNEDGSPKQLIPGGPFKVSSFNFDFKEKDRNMYDALQTYEYLEPDTFIPLLDRIFNREENNIGEVLMGDVRRVYDYLAKKLRETKTIHEFRQVTDVFKHLFLVDPERDWYESGEIDVDAYLCDTYQLTYYELSTLKAFFNDENPEDFITVHYNEKDYDVSLHDVLNMDVLEISFGEGDDTENPFRDNVFVALFQSELSKYHSQRMEEESGLTINIRLSYKDIISDKVVLNIGNGIHGPKTFEALLFRNDPDMYKYLITLRSNPETLILMMRSLVKSLESYTNTLLPGLEFAAIGQDEYFSILKQVIGYFKSYMVEYTKDEFTYIMDGLFDEGGNSNMLKLFDEIVHTKIRGIIKESLTLHDASHITNNGKIADYGLRALHDEVIVRRRAAYKKIKELGIPIIFDTGEYVTKFPINVPNDDDKLIFSIYETDDGETQIRIYL